MKSYYQHTYQCGERKTNKLQTAEKGVYNIGIQKKYKYIQNHTDA